MLNLIAVKKDTEGKIIARLEYNTIGEYNAPFYCYIDNYLNNLPNVTIHVKIIMVSSCMDWRY